MEKPSTDFTENCKWNKNIEHEVLQSNMKASINWFENSITKFEIEHAYV